MGKTKQEGRQQRFWLIFAYTLGSLAVFGMRSGMWRCGTITIAAVVLITVIGLLLRCKHCRNLNAI